MRTRRSMDDFSDADVAWLMDRAAAHREGSASRVVPPPVVGLLFLETSLRTRLGFSAAAARLGGWPLQVFEQRHSAISMDESVAHTVRALSGYCDVIVTRLPVPLNSDVLPLRPRCPILSGGDRGPAGEHPTQALIDLFALRNDLGGAAGRSVVVVGDPRMRSVVSLCRLLVRQGVGEIRVLTVPGLLAGRQPPGGVADRVRAVFDWSDAAGADFLYVAGIPHEAVSLEDRDRLRLTPERLAGLGEGCVVTSPLPVIDEIDEESWADPRLRAFEHSDDALFVRMALLELVLGAAG
jgi:aspartate carbamoyltransferase catalytic subunit